MAHVTMALQLDPLGVRRCEDRPLISEPEDVDRGISDVVLDIPLRDLEPQ